MYNGKIEIESFVIKSDKKMAIGVKFKVKVKKGSEEAVSVVSFILSSLGMQ